MYSILSRITTYKEHNPVRKGEISLNSHQTKAETFSAESVETTDKVAVTTVIFMTQNS